MAKFNDDSSDEDMILDMFLDDGNVDTIGAAVVSHCITSYQVLMSPSCRKTSQQR